MNYTSYTPFFSSSIRADDEFMSPIRPGRGIHEAAAEGRDWDETYDLAALLPADPFGMNLSSTLSAFADFMRDFGAAAGGSAGGYEFYLGDASAFGHWMDEEPSVSEEAPTAREEEEASASSSGHHEGLLFSLRYLGVWDLLAVERVCRSLRFAVQSDSLLWKCIHIDAPPLSERITDEALLRLAQKAQGWLQCLSLVDCSKITDDGLRRVLEISPRLQKLSVSGCRRLSIEGLIHNLKAFESSGLSSGFTGLKQLKLGRLFSLLPEHYEDLRSLLGRNEVGCQPIASKPQFYHCGVSSLACDDDRAIDIEICPECQNLKFVYDCPSESCRAKGLDHCRACDSCIIRCSQCGRCMKDCRYEETFLLDYICRGCLEAQSEDRMEE